MKRSPVNVKQGPVNIKKKSERKFFKKMHFLLKNTDYFQINI